MINATASDRHVEQLFDVIHRLHAALSRAGVDYRIVGGMSVFLQVSQKDPLAARLTRDVDVAIHREDLARIADAVASFGFQFRHTAGVDMLVDASQPKARSAIHFVFAREKVHPDYLEPVPGFSAPDITQEGILLAPVSDLLRMTLTIFRLKDKVHIIDTDSVGLITPEIEETLLAPPLQRLMQVRDEDRQSTGAE